MLKSLTCLTSSKNGYVLPTLLIASLVLLIIMLSSLQLGGAVSRSVNDQNWNRLAKQAAQAGVSYAKSCLEQATDPTTALGNNAQPIQPNTDCSGIAISGGPDQYIARDMTSTTSVHYRTTFKVARQAVATGDIPRARVTGTVELLAATTNVVTKTYTSDMTVLLSVTGGGEGSTSLSDNNFAEAGGSDNGLYGEPGPVGPSFCNLRADKTFWCRGAFGLSSKQPARQFKLPGTEKVKLVKYLRTPANNALIGVCVLSDLDYLYCIAQVGNSGTNNNTVSALGIGVTSAAAVNPSEVAPLVGVSYPVSTAAKRFSIDATTPIEIKKLWDMPQLTIGNNANSVVKICVLAKTDITYCAGNNGNAYGEFGKGDTTSPTNGYAVASFNSGAYFSAAGGVKVKSFVPVKVTADYPSVEYTINRANFQCVIGTKNAADQVYCSGPCGIGQNNLTGARAYGLLFGTEENGYGRGCGSSTAQSTSNSSNPSPACSPSFFPCAGGDLATWRYNSPVKFVLPSGLTVKEALITISPKHSSGDAYGEGYTSSNLCVIASNYHTYCTVWKFEYNNPNYTMTAITEPTDLESL